jgi:hypothetical protein
MLSIKRLTNLRLKIHLRIDQLLIITFLDLLNDVIMLNWFVQKWKASPCSQSVPILINYNKSSLFLIKKTIRSQCTVNLLPTYFIRKETTSLKLLHSTINCKIQL